MSSRRPQSFAESDPATRFTTSSFCVRASHSYESLMEPSGCAPSRTVNASCLSRYRAPMSSGQLDEHDASQHVARVPTMPAPNGYAVVVAPVPSLAS